MRSHDLGRSSEEIACRHLQSNGWRILHRNYRAGPREIDIIARREGTIAFIEVKARTGRDYGGPFAAVTWRKRRYLTNAARAWLAENAAHHCELRFDAIAITWSGACHTLEHIEDAWRKDIR